MVYAAPRNYGPKRDPGPIPISIGLTSRLLFIAMLRRMMFCCLLCMLGSLEMVPVGNVSVMSCLFMRAFLVMLGRFMMMACCMLMMPCCLLMVLCTLMFSHILIVS